MHRFTIVTLSLFFKLSFQSFGDIKSLNGPLVFNSEGDSIIEATISSDNLSLHNNAFVAGNLVVYGNIIQRSSAFKTGANTIDKQSIVFADTTDGDVVLGLPDPTTCEDRMITVKRTSLVHDLYITGSGEGIEGKDNLTLMSGQRTSITLGLYNDHWYVMDDNGTASAKEVASVNLIVDWPMDDDTGLQITDDSVNLYHGQLSGMTDLSGNSTQGVKNNAIVMATDNIILSRHNLPMNNSGYTYSFWIKSETPSSDPIVREPLISGKAGFVWASGNSMLHRSAYHECSPGDYKHCSASGDFDANTWYHIASTWDGDSLDLFINGKKENSILAPSWTGSNNVNINSPNHYDSGSFFFDEVKVFDRALSEHEVKAIFMSHKNSI
jgi:hypothetical protein